MFKNFGHVVEVNKIPVYVVGLFFDSFFLALPFNICVIGFKQVSFHLHKNERKSCHLFEKRKLLLQSDREENETCFLASRCFT